MSQQRQILTRRRLRQLLDDGVDINLEALEFAQANPENRCSSSAIFLDQNLENEAESENFENVRDSTVQKSINLADVSEKQLGAEEASDKEIDQTEKIDKGKRKSEKENLGEKFQEIQQGTKNNEMILRKNPMHLKAFHTSQNKFNRLEAALILDKIPDLTGKEGSDKLRAFFRRFDLGTEEWSDAQRIRALQSKVEGKAERALNAAIDNEEAYSRTPHLSYLGIKKRMIQTLENLDAREAHAFDELFNGLKRRPNEDIQQLAERVFSAVRCAYPGLNQYLVEDYAIKHFLRALDSPEVALSLEMSRNRGMSYDEFITLAARAEATKNVFRGRSRQNNLGHMNNRENSWRETRICYACGMPGHIAPYCQERKVERQRNFGNENLRNSAFESNRGANFEVPKQQTNRRFVQCVRVNEIASESKKEISEAPKEIEKWIKEIKEEEKMAPKVGKLVKFDLFFNGEKASAIADGGAQVSVISSKFLEDLLNKDVISLNSENFSRDSSKLVDINDNKILSYGVVSLPVNRRNTRPVNVCFHISPAPFESNVIVGTNALGAIGFKMFDEANSKKIEFECLEEKEGENTQVRAIFSTFLASESPKLEKDESKIEGKMEKKLNDLESEIKPRNEIKMKENCRIKPDGPFYIFASNLNLNEKTSSPKDIEWHQNEVYKFFGGSKNLFHVQLFTPLRSGTCMLRAKNFKSCIKILRKNGKKFNGRQIKVEYVLQTVDPPMKCSSFISRQLKMEMKNYKINLVNPLKNSLGEKKREKDSDRLKSELNQNWKFRKGKNFEKMKKKGKIYGNKGDEKERKLKKNGSGRKESPEDRPNWRGERCSLGDRYCFKNAPTEIREPRRTCFSPPFRECIAFEEKVLVSCRR
ncbi:hypothetical protein ACQ4LE_002443 [Meloidogyne hapla]